MKQTGYNTLQDLICNDKEEFEDKILPILQNMKANERDIRIMFASKWYLAKISRWEIIEFNKSINKNE